MPGNSSSQRELARVVLDYLRGGERDAGELAGGSDAQVSCTSQVRAALPRPRSRHRACNADRPGVGLDQRGQHVHRRRRKREAPLMVAAPRTLSRPSPDSRLHAASTPQRVGEVSPGRRCLACWGGLRFLHGQRQVGVARAAELSAMTPFSRWRSHPPACRPPHGSAGHDAVADICDGAARSTQAPAKAADKVGSMHHERAIGIRSPRNR